SQSCLYDPGFRAHDPGCHYGIRPAADGTQPGVGREGRAHQRHTRVPPLALVVAHGRTRVGIPVAGVAHLQRRHKCLPDVPGRFSSRRGHHLVHRQPRHIPYSRGTVAGDAFPLRAGRGNILARYGHWSPGHRHAANPREVWDRCLPGTRRSRFSLWRRRVGSRLHGLGLLCLTDPVSRCRDHQSHRPAPRQPAQAKRARETDLILCALLNLDTPVLALLFFYPRVWLPFWAGIRRGTIKAFTDTCTTSSSWLNVVLRTRTIPCRGRDLDSRLLSTSASTRNSSPARTGFGQRSSSIPAPTSPPATCRLPSTSMRMVTAAVCHPLAASPPKIVSLAASSSR